MKENHKELIELFIDGEKTTIIKRTIARNGSHATKMSCV